MQDVFGQTIINIFAIQRNGNASTHTLSNQSMQHSPCLCLVVRLRLTYRDKIRKIVGVAISVITSKTCLVPPPTRLADNPTQPNPLSGGHPALAVP